MNHYEPVSGYLELGMKDEALQELEALPVSEKESERYNELLLAIQMMQKSWVNAASTARWLCNKNAEENAYFIHTAFCLHESGETEAALHFLVTGPSALRTDPLYHYNLACYMNILGEKRNAQAALKKALDLDPELREEALEDKDLEGLEF